MNTNCKSWGWLGMIIFCSVSLAGAQQQDAEARRFFLLGLREKDAQKKIAAYNQALSLDSEFVEALFNIGLAYRQELDYMRAEQFLLRALHARPERTSVGTKTQILYELGRIAARLGKTAENETYLRGAKALAAEPEVRATIIWELCNTLKIQGRYAEALGEAREGQTLHSERASAFGTLTSQLENEIPAQRAGTGPSTGTSAASLDSLYRAAVQAQNQKDWLQALRALEKLQILQPGFRDTAQRLQQVRQDILPGAATTAQARGQWAKTTSLLALLGALPIVGFALFSSTLRARYYMLRSDHAAAAQIYEKILTRRPQRTQLYPTLANLYLVLGRRDESALKVFKTILQLNLPTPFRDHINSVVAEHFLREGRTDADAIAVLESALAAERRRLRA